MRAVKFAGIAPEWILALTPVVIVLTHYAAVLPHEFAHSFTAWATGIKADPLDIDWGGTSLSNILLLMNIDENVDYDAAFAAGRNWEVAVAAFAGPGLVNGGLYLLSRAAVWARPIVERPLLTYCLFWFLFMNLANLYDYVPMRVFSPRGDVAHFSMATQIGPWAIYAVGGYLVLAAIVDFYRHVLPVSLDGSGFDRPVYRAAILVIASALLLSYFAIPGLLQPDEISRFMAGTSFLLVPVAILAAWRRTVLG